MATSEASGRARSHRPLSWAPVAGASHDICFAVLLVTAPQLASRWFALPLAERGFYPPLVAEVTAWAGRSLVW
jgi:hypothetical protein